MRYILAEITEGNYIFSFIMDTTKEYSKRCVCHIVDIAEEGIMTDEDGKIIEKFFEKISFKYFNNFCKKFASDEDYRNTYIKKT